MVNLNLARSKKIVALRLNKETCAKLLTLMEAEGKTKSGIVRKLIEDRVEKIENEEARERENFNSAITPGVENFLASAKVRKAAVEDGKAILWGVTAGQKKTKFLMLRLDEGTYQILRKIAAEEHKSMAKLARQAIWRSLRQSPLAAESGKRGE